METILRIEKGFFLEDLPEDYYGPIEFDGYIIETTEQTIKIGISANAQCCEDFGTITTNDEIEEFIGAKLISIARVDQALNSKKIDELRFLDEGGAMFINFETSEGLLQFVAFNGHNGYYGHDAVLISKQMSIQDSF